QKWKKFWGVLYRESSCSTARLELLEGSGPVAAERPRKAEGGRRLVRLSDCVHVAEAGGDASCPKDTVPFLLETTERRFLLAADGAEAADWIQRLCELAFPRSREEPGAAKEGSLGTEGEFSMEENSLYSSRGKGRSGEGGVGLGLGLGLLRAKAKAGMPPGVGEPSGPFQALQGSDFPYAEPRDSLRLGKAPEKGWRQEGAKVESDYAVPFDAIAKSFLARQLGGLGCAQEGPPEPPRGSREAQRGQQPPGRPAAPKPEHIYDEPEALCALSVYDEPEEVKGEAWRLQAAPEEPPGQGCPYNPQRDDYAVPKRPVPLRQPFLLQGKEWLGHSEYDNVALRGASK
ncbi:DOK2 protein, partial [Myiagra hebetior]|nr:DOK2 protein [Myiagra hebetior]